MKNKFCTECSQENLMTAKFCLACQAEFPTIQVSANSKPVVTKNKPTTKPVTKKVIEDPEEGVSVDLNNISEEDNIQLIGNFINFFEKKGALKSRKNGVKLEETLGGGTPRNGRRRAGKKMSAKEILKSTENVRGTGEDIEIDKNLLNE